MLIEMGAGPAIPAPFFRDSRKPIWFAWGSKELVAAPNPTELDPPGRKVNIEPLNLPGQFSVRRREAIMRQEPRPDGAVEVGQPGLANAVEVGQLVTFCGVGFQDENSPKDSHQTECPVGKERQGESLVNCGRQAEYRVSAGREGMPGCTAPVSWQEDLSAVPSTFIGVHAGLTKRLCHMNVGGRHGALPLAGAPADLAVALRHCRSRCTRGFMARRPSQRLSKLLEKGNPGKEERKKSRHGATRTGPAFRGGGGLLIPGLATFKEKPGSR